MVTRWTFTDPSMATPNVVTFAINPNAGGTPSRKKTVTSQATAASDGTPLIFEGADEPLDFEWSGVFTDESQYDMFADWYRKHHQILLTDDLGRTNWIYIVEFDEKRTRASHHKFRHEYTAKATLLDWE